MNGLSVEERISLSNIEFRAENGITELVRIKMGKDYNPFVLENSHSTADYCYRILNKSISSFPKVYSWLLLDGKMEEMALNSKKAKSVLEKITKEESVSSEEIDEGINFFTKLIERCKEYVQRTKQI